MDSIVIERDASRAGRAAATVVARTAAMRSVDPSARTAFWVCCPSGTCWLCCASRPPGRCRRTACCSACGDEGRSVVLILQGYVKLSTMAPNGREVVLEIAGPGSIFGETRRAERFAASGGRHDADVMPRDGDRRRAVPALARRHAGGDVRGDTPAERTAVRGHGAGDGRGIAAGAGAAGEGAAASGEAAFGSRRRMACRSVSACRSASLVR